MRARKPNNEGDASSWAKPIRREIVRNKEQWRPLTTKIGKEASSRESFQKFVKFWVFVRRKDELDPTNPKQTRNEKWKNLWKRSRQRKKAKKRGKKWAKGPWTPSTPIFLCSYKFAADITFKPSCAWFSVIFFNFKLVKFRPFGGGGYRTSLGEPM